MFSNDLHCVYGMFMIIQLKWMQSSSYYIFDEFTLNMDWLKALYYH